MGQRAINKEPNKLYPLINALPFTILVISIISIYIYMSDIIELFSYTTK